MPFLHSMCIDNNWILKNATTSLGKLLFKNGYFDLTTGVFHKEFDPDIVFLSRVDMDYKNLMMKG